MIKALIESINLHFTADAFSTLDLKFSGLIMHLCSKLEMLLRMALGQQERVIWKVNEECKIFINKLKPNLADSAWTEETCKPPYPLPSKKKSATT